MQPMTPEERFTKIENALEALAESQARHDLQIGNLITRMEKQDAAIRDLIVVSRTLVDSQQAAFKAIDQLTEKLDRLTENIDKLLRRPGPNGNVQA